jgi:hypothetical protein
LPPTGDPELFARAHRQLLADPQIQFDLPRLPIPQLPAWLRALAHFLDGVAPGLRYAFWGVIILFGLLILYLLVRWLQGADWLRRRRRGEDETGTDNWRPEEAPARALLGEADALAAAGDFDAAAHLLLRRSIEELDRNRPQLVRPALTSRDLAGAPAMPSGPRGAFARIAMAVEKSLFGGRALAEQEWRDCRASYEEFAFSAEWQG